MSNRETADKFGYCWP